MSSGKSKATQLCQGWLLLLLTLEIRDIIWGGYIKSLRGCQGGFQEKTIENDIWAIWVMKSDGSGERKLFDLDGTLNWAEHISWAP